MSMLVRQFLLAYSCLLLFSCREPANKAEPIKADSISKALSIDTTTLNKTDTVIRQHDTITPRKRKIPVVDIKGEPSEMLDEIPVREENSIQPGSVTNTYQQTQNQLVFQSIVIEDQDLRVGCSGGVNKLTFSIPLTADSFSYTNAGLQKLQLQYRVDGGLYFATGENPRKGKIAGSKKDDSTWIVEMDILVPMHSDQRQQEERPIKRKIEFSKVN